MFVDEDQLAPIERGLLLKPVLAGRLDVRPGIGLEPHQSRCPHRIVIAMLANYALCQLGLQVREAEYERRFQSNSLKCKRVPSLWRLELEYAHTGAGAISRETLRNLELAPRRELYRQVQKLG